MSTGSVLTFQKTVLYLFSLISFVDVSRGVVSYRNHWALLVAGSNGYGNYRHQADVCHAYHVLRNHGFPEDRIIVMMYDDIAHNPQNPTPGVIINQPNGDNVYANVKIDYRGENVTAKYFLDILAGNKGKMQNIGTGRVVDSGPNDNIFVNFVDHGAPGLLFFPNFDNQLARDDFIETLRIMHLKRKYKKMVIYVEACESGSMFEGVLPENTNIYATTAANQHEPSWQCYWSKKYNTFLGDVYSVKWMQDSEKKNLNAETLLEQFLVVKQETNTSHVQEYGQKNISGEFVGEFQGNKTSSTSTTNFPEISDAVRSEDGQVVALTKRLTSETRFHQRLHLTSLLANELQRRISIQKIFETIAKNTLKSNSPERISKTLNERLLLNNWSCYKSSYQQFDKQCMKLAEHEFIARHLYILVNLCELGFSAQQISSAIETSCQ